MFTTCLSRFERKLTGLSSIRCHLLVVRNFDWPKDLRIVKTFNDQFGTLFTDADRVVNRIQTEIAPKVAADPAYQNAKKNTPAAAPIELEAALKRAIVPLYKDDTELFKQFFQNESFRRF